MDKTAEWAELDGADVQALIAAKLAALGVESPNELLVAYETDRAAELIQNIIHQPYVPAGLKYVLTDRVCAAVLDTAYNTGAVGEAPVSSIKVGDTQIGYSGTQSIQSVIEELRTSGEHELQRYRKLCF